MKEWEKNIRKVIPYTPGEQPNVPGMIKLNTNENPYPPSLGILQAIRGFNGNQLRLYPDANATPLVDALTDYYGLKSGQVFVGVGSDDVLAMAFLTFFNSELPILFPNITYSFYDVWANLYHIPYECPPVDQDFKIRKEDYYKENGGIVIANPNAPTSIYENLAFIEDILLHNKDAIVIVDEAYIDFGGRSAISLIHKYDNLLVVQTFSKSRSMAGMRIGYAIGNEELIQSLNNIKHSYNSYTMNLSSICFGVESVKDKAYFEDCIKKIILTRERVKEELSDLGFLFPDSKTNFIFATHKEISAKELFLAMKEKNIFVRYFDKPLIDNYLRITIGTDEEMDQVIRFIKNFLTKKL